MTRQGIIFTIVAISTTLIGLLFRWQEFLLIGLFFAVVSIISALFVVYAPTSFLTCREHIVSATRTMDASFNIDVDSHRKRGLFIEFSGGPIPYLRIPTPQKRGQRTVRVQIDTRSRCDVYLGSVKLIVSDAFGFFKRSIATSSPIRVVVQPRVIEISSPISLRNRGNNDEGRRSGWGSQLSELLTEYQPGDELRRINWRNSAKFGKLMVRKELSPESNDVMLCLDTDANSYSITKAFAITPEIIDFEIFLELFVSLALAQTKSGIRVRVFTTGSNQTFDLRHGMTTQFILLMAKTELVRSGKDGLEHLLKSTRLYKPRQILFVTSNPDKHTLGVLTELSTNTKITVFGSNMTPDVRGANLDARSISLKTS